MSPEATPTANAAAPRATGRRLKSAALAVLLTLASAALAFALAELLAMAGVDVLTRWAAPLAAGVVVAGVGLPLVWLLLALLPQLERSRQLLARQSAGEPSASIAGRTQFLALAEREWARARRYGDGAALLLVDIDRYSALCDARGAGAGDAVLQALAASTGPTLRGADAIGRFGGSQLAVWLAQADPLGALDAAERIRERIETLDLVWRQQAFRVTVSVGVAPLRPAHQNVTGLFDDAEAGVQAARQTGGNCVRAATVDALRPRKIGPSVGDNQAAGPGNDPHPDPRH